MTPIYFPFTWAEVPTVQAITAVFPKFALYRPAHRASSLLLPFEQAGSLEIRVPVTKDSNKLASLVSDYQNWARLHRGSDLTFFKARQPAAPFIDHLSSQIQSDILHYQDSPTDQAHDPVFNARLFLEIASAFDAQQADLNRDLANIQDLEKNFAAALGDHTGTEEPVSLGNVPLFQDDPGDFMLPERLQAWSRLFLQDRQQRTAEDVWVTSRLSVVEWIRDEAEMEPVLEINCIPILKTIDDNTRFWQESVMAYLHELQAAPWPSTIKTFEPPSSDYAWENAVSVKGFIIPNQSPDSLFQKMAGEKSARMTDSGHHTLIVCVSLI